MKRFTAYRKNINQRDTHNELQKNIEIIWHDGNAPQLWLEKVFEQALKDKNGKV